MSEAKSYYIVIPGHILEDDGLSAKCQVLFGHIAALCSSSGECWASNAYLAKVIRVDKTTVSKYISTLEDRGHIKSTVERSETGEVKARYIKIPIPPLYIPNTPPREIAKDIVENNTEENITTTVNTGKSPIGGVLWDNGRTELQKLIGFYIRTEMPFIYSSADKTQVGGFYRQYGKLFSNLLATAGSLDVALRAMNCASAYYKKLGYSWGLKALNTNWGEFVNQAIAERR